MHLHVAPHLPASRSAAERVPSFSRAVAQLAAVSKKKPKPPHVALPTGPQSELDWNPPLMATVTGKANPPSISAPVGDYGHARINPKHPFHGHGTASNESKEFYDYLDDVYHGPFVRGHLINAMMGGSNTDANLFPITIAANNRHKSSVENHVKSWMTDANTLWIDYSVDVMPGANVVEGAEFFCEAQRWPQANPQQPDKKVDRRIESTPIKKAQPNQGSTANWNPFPGDTELATHLHTKGMTQKLAALGWVDAQALGKTDRQKINALLTPNKPAGKAKAAKAIKRLIRRNAQQAPQGAFLGYSAV